MTKTGFRLPTLFPTTVESICLVLDGRAAVVMGALAVAWLARERIVRGIVVVLRFAGQAVCVVMGGGRDAEAMEAIADTVAGLGDVVAVIAAVIEE